MSEPKIEFQYLHEILSFLEAKICAADAAADAQQTCSSHSADVAVDVAADV